MAPTRPQHGSEFPAGATSFLALNFRINPVPLLNPLLLSAIIAIASVLAVGAIARRQGILTGEADASLMKLVINVLFPCFIFSKVTGNKTLMDWHSAIIIPAIGFAVLAISFGLCWLAASKLCPLPEFRDPRKLRTFTVSTGLQNYGYMAIPLIDSLFTNSTMIGVLHVHNVGVEIALWTLGVMIFDGGLKGQWWRKVLNPPTLAVLASILLNLSGLYQYLPQCCLKTTEIIGQAAMPMGILLVGATIYDYLPKESGGLTKMLRQALPLVLLANVMRCLVLPGVILLIAVKLPGISLELRQVLVIQAAMPAAFLPIVMAKHYDGDVETALRITLSSLFLGLVSIGFWASLGLHLLKSVKG